MSLVDLIKNYYKDQKTEIDIKDNPEINGGRILTITVIVSELTNEEKLQKEVDRLKQENADLQVKLDLKESIDWLKNIGKKPTPLTRGKSTAVPYYRPWETTCKE